MMGRPRCLKGLPDNNNASVGDEERQSTLAIDRMK
ncbi:hypothetical protein AWB64_01418 [Caballeronia sordidicola]|uniref:Uncharacterized protein n=1 Tax=Caballeronia sordidicola TaxID=196367 RepID=A0A158FJU8_CABSO|nr:hypothetical protein AWB64_01418 [Caballeronia sordidicola]